MALAPGARLGGYEIRSLIGQGGMGEVYRATDTRLRRDVAIKILPEIFARDPDRIARFQREAELLATLNHANIAAVYGIEESSGATALILELVEGDTLAERIARGPLDLEEALAIARQLVEALEAAHDRGVIHRDLKPANIKITPEGKVKVLDFGLAKMAEREAAVSGLSMSPTLSVQATYAGMIPGTAAYMSPEQARGKPVDRKTDIWAFGCVLYETLTGRQAFDDGDTVSDAIAAVLKNDVDWKRLPAETPPAVTRLLRRCLQKDPQKRLPHIGIVRIDLDDESDAQPAATTRSGNRVARRSFAQRALPILIAAAATSVATAVAVTWRTNPAPPTGVTRFALLLPEGQQFTGTGRRAIAIAPDGRRIAYVANRQVYVREMSSNESRPVRGTNNLGAVVSPAFSPDGLELAFATDNARTIKRIAIDGGVPVTVARLDSGVASIVWDASGIVFAQASAIRRVSPAGSDQETQEELKARVPTR